MAKTTTSVRRALRRGDLRQYVRHARERCRPLVSAKSGTLAAAGAVVGGVAEVVITSGAAGWAPLLGGLIGAVGAPLVWVAGSFVVYLWTAPADTWREYAEGLEASYDTSQRTLADYRQRLRIGATSTSPDVSLSAAIEDDAVYLAVANSGANEEFRAKVVSLKGSNYKSGPPSLTLRWHNRATEGQSVGPASAEYVCLAHLSVRKLPENRLFAQYRLFQPKGEVIVWDGQITNENRPDLELEVAIASTSGPYYKTWRVHLGIKPDSRLPGKLGPLAVVL